MDIRNLEIGMKVRIDKFCSKTNRTFSLSNSMKKMRGTTQVVSDINIDEKRVRVGHISEWAWTWHPDDLYPQGDLLDEEKEIKPETFNPNDLVLD